MHIGIDLTALWRPMTGQETVAIEMTRAMLNLDRKNEYLLFFSGEVHRSFRDLAGNFREVILPVRHEVVNKNVYLPFLPAMRGLDFLHFPIFPPPWWCRCPHGWTMPDAAPWLYPKTMKAKSRFYFKALGQLAMKRCQVIITDTEAARRELTGLFGSHADKVRVIYPGIRPIFRPFRDATMFNKVRNKYSLPAEFVLCVSTLEPRKNILGLIRAFAKLKSEGKFTPSLVIAGKKRWHYERMFAEVSSLGLREVVKFTDYVPDEDLLAFYNMARAFVYPSFYEGFGLPCVEAMAVGCPVVTSDRGALLEVTGNAALHAEPENINSLAAAIRSSCEDEPLRKKLINGGFERSRVFSWKTYAEDMLKALEEAVA